jgi:very-short-patch-repair endonuclease
MRLRCTSCWSATPYRAGNGVLKDVLKDLRPEGERIRSRLEGRFKWFLRERRIKRPELNADLFVAGHFYEADCLWRDERVIVELDARSTHPTPLAFERDRARDRVLQAAGWRIVRVTWRQLHEDGDALAVDLRTLLRGGKRKA